MVIGRERYAVINDIKQTSQDPCFCIANTMRKTKMFIKVKLLHVKCTSQIIRFNFPIDGEGFFGINLDNIISQ
jgi:hypothetical protein